MAKEVTKEIRITDEHLISLVDDERRPGENTPAKTITRAIVELQTMRRTLERGTPNTTALPISA